jgi:ADP-ribose pyrophosphatase YjhB (NUDIX family)
LAEALFQLGQKALIVNEKSEILVVGQHPPNEPDKLWFDLPGGRVDEGEDDLDKALARELHEELRIEAKVHELLTLSIAPKHPSRKYDILLAVYHCTITKGEPTPSDDIVEAKWIPIDELHKIPRSRYTKEIVEDFKRQLDL